jgi:anaerobic ribonucleoside-triphosphate reductase
MCFSSWRNIILILGYELNVRFFIVFLRFFGKFLEKYLEVGYNYIFLYPLQLINHSDVVIQHHTTCAIEKALHKWEGGQMEQRMDR